MYLEVLKSENKCVSVDECKVIAMTAGTEAAEEEQGSGQVRCSR